MFAKHFYSPTQKFFQLDTPSKPTPNPTKFPSSNYRKITNPLKIPIYQHLTQSTHYHYHLNPKTHPKPPISPSKNHTKFHKISPSNQLSQPHTTIYPINFYDTIYNPKLTIFIIKIIPTIYHLKIPLKSHFHPKSSSNSPLPHICFSTQYETCIYFFMPIGQSLLQHPNLPPTPPHFTNSTIFYSISYILRI